MRIRIYGIMLFFLLQGCASTYHRYGVFGLTFYKGQPYVLVREEIGKASAPFYSHHVESRTDQYKMYVGNISRDAINAHKGVAWLGEVARYPFGLSGARLIGDNDSLLVVLVTDINWHCSDVIGVCREYDVYDQYKNVTSISGSGKFYVDNILYGFRNNSLKKIGGMVDAVKYDKFGASPLSSNAKYIVVGNDLIEVNDGRAMAPVSLDKQCFHQDERSRGSVSYIEDVEGGVAVIYGQVYLPKEGKYFSGICFPVAKTKSIVWVDAKLTQPDTFSESFLANNGILYSAFIDDYADPKNIILTAFNVLKETTSTSAIPIIFDSGKSDEIVPVALFRTNL